MRIAFIIFVSTLFAAEAAANPDTLGDTSAEEIETIETVETVEEVETEGGKEWTVAKVLGRLHPSAVHFPIGGIALALLFAFSALRDNDGRAARFSAWFSVLAAGAAVLTGFLRSDEMKAAGANSDPIDLHRNVMLLFVAAALLAALALWRARDRRSIYMGLALTLAAFALVSVGGHLGGNIVYGSDFLPF